MKETLWAQVAQDLAGKIADGSFPVGSLLPTEFELCDRYGASRHTVRAAIRELQDQGLVSRRKKVGTRVEAVRPSSFYRQSLASVAELVQFGAAHRRVVQEVKPVVADRALARLLGCEPRSQWLRVSSLRLDTQPGAPPVGWTDVYLDPSLSGVAELARTSPDVLMSTLIEQHYGRRIEEIQQDITATAIPGRLAGKLAATAGAPALQIVRRYIDHAAGAFEISVTLHPAERFTFSTRLRRERAE
jgi:DNA-binding GntR family transcriptional regulator